VRAEPFDEDDLPLIIDRDDQSVGVALDIEYNAVAAHDAGVRVARGYVGGRVPIRALDLVEPGIQRRLDGFLIFAAAE
jgi:hypothetical protein